MKRLTLLFLAMLFPLAAHAVIRSQVYTTNGEPAVDAHVIALITGPTNGISLATATNVINGMATTLSVLHSTNADNARFATNAAPGGNIVSNYFATVIEARGAGDTIYVQQSEVAAQNGTWHYLLTNTVAQQRCYTNAASPDLFLCFYGGLASVNFWGFDTSTNDPGGGGVSVFSAAGRISGLWFQGDGSFSAMNVSIGALETNTIYYALQNTNPAVTYVDPSGPKNGNNVIASRGGFPFADFDHAARVALPGDTIIHKPGISKNNFTIVTNNVSVVGYGNSSLLEYEYTLVNPDYSELHCEPHVRFSNLAFSNVCINVPMGASVMTNLILNNVWIFDQHSADVILSECISNDFDNVNVFGGYDIFLKFENGSIKNSKIVFQDYSNYWGSVAANLVTGTNNLLVNTLFYNTNSAGGAGLLRGNNNKIYGCTFIHGTNMPAIQAAATGIVGNWSDNGTNVSMDGFLGNAAALTNLQASAIVGGLTVVQTNSWGIVQSIDYVNIDSGKLYTNTTAGNQKIHAHGHVWFAADVVGVSSATRLDMIVNDQYTNSLRWALNQGASTPIQGDVEGEFVAEVPPGGFYYWTNLSSGGGGSPTNEIINPVQIITTSNIVSRFYFTNGVLMNTTTP